MPNEGVFLATRKQWSYTPVISKVNSPKNPWEVGFKPSPRPTTNLIARCSIVLRPVSSVKNKVVNSVVVMVISNCNQL